ncbi:hypothetical protein CUMW_285530 [Citrus unshiu]|uniref:Uncharacterized protein n=1 Tax=Citrus unshiu TaxID=55188 RepID=A0A2H5MY17_CITUN|nr:hypothetical protein CUMW_285530 [Citrus unshiu]
MVCSEIKLVRIGLSSLELIMTSKILLVVLLWWFIVAKSISLNQQQQERLRKEFTSIEASWSVAISNLKREDT